MFELMNINNSNNYIEVFINKIDKINSLKEDFWCDFTIKKYYIFEEPTLEIDNLIKYTKEKIKKYDININEKLYKCIEYNYFGKLKSKFNFRDFPKDNQQLMLKIKSNVELFTLNYKINDSDLFLSDHEFSLDNNKHFYPIENEILYTFQIKRNSRNYFWNIVFLNFLIAFTSFASFSIHNDNSADRLNINGMLLLTKVAFKQVNSNLIPATSYLTFLDKYVFCGLGFLFLIILQNGLSVYMGDIFEYYSIIILSSIFTLYNFIFLILWHI
jgi:hypothetical protein